MLRNLLTTTLALCLISHPVLAERADRNKPIHVEANRLTMDDDQRVQILEGDVLLTQGTLRIQSDKLVITEDAQGFQKGVATGGPKGKATFRQKREGKTDYVEGEGERIEYDTRTEVAELFQKAWVKSGQDLVKGEYIWYDSVSEKYTANSALPGNVNDRTGRVRAILQPRNKTDPTPPQADHAPVLRSSKHLHSLPTNKQ